MKMNLELFISQLSACEAYAEGEDLYSNGGKITISGTDKYLVSAMVAEEQGVEVEILKPFTKSQSTTCDCGKNKKKAPCRHVIAVLLKLAQEKIASQKNKEIIKSKLPDALSVKLILSNVDFESIKTFIKQYALKDQKFSNAIKIHFAAQVDVNDNAAKYKSVLNNIIKPNVKSNTRPTFHQIRQFLTAGIDLLGQLEDKTVLGEVDEALLILMAYITKAHYVLHYSQEVLKEEQLTLLQKYYENCVDAFESKDVAPELKGELSDFFKSLIDLSYYSCLQTGDVNAYLLLYKFSDVSKTELVNKILQHIQQKENIAELQNLYYSYFLIENNGIKIIPQHYSYQLPVVTKLADLKHFQVAKKVIKCLTENQALSGAMVNILVKIELELKSPLNAIDAAVEGFISTKDLSIIDFAKKIFSDNDFKTMSQRLIDTLVDQNINQNTFGYLLVKTENQNQLLVFLQEKKDLQLLMQFDSYLYPKYTSELKSLYKLLIEEFISQINSRIQRTYLQEILQHLQNIKAFDIRSELSYQIAILTKEINTQFN